MIDEEHCGRNSPLGNHDNVAALAKTFGLRPGQVSNGETELSFATSTWADDGVEQTEWRLVGLEIQSVTGPHLRQLANC